VVDTKMRTNGAITNIFIIKGFKNEDAEQYAPY